MITAESRKIYATVAAEYLNDDLKLLLEDVELCHSDEALILEYLDTHKSEMFTRYSDIRTWTTSDYDTCNTLLSDLINEVLKNNNEVQ